MTYRQLRPLHHFSAAAFRLERPASKSLPTILSMLMKTVMRYNSICALPVNQRNNSIAPILMRINSTETAAAISKVPLSMKL